MSHSNYLIRLGFNKTQQLTVIACFMVAYRLDIFEKVIVL